MFISDWVHGILVDSCMSNIESMFETLNNKVSSISTELGQTPSSWNVDIFSMIENISKSVILPIAGLILTFVAVYELVTMVISNNNLSNFETATFFKWLFKTCIAVLILTNCWEITMAVFDLAQHVIQKSAGIITNSVVIDSSYLDAVRTNLEENYGIGALLVLFLETFLCKFAVQIMSIIIMVIVYGRMIEIYLRVSVAPIPFATLINREIGHMGQNYLKSLFALGFQGFLILVCVAIYAALISGIDFSSGSGVMSGIWLALFYAVLLCLTLCKTGSVSKSIFGVS